MWLEERNSNGQKKAITTEVCPMYMLTAGGIHMPFFTEKKKTKRKQNKHPSFGLRKKHNIVNLIS